MADNFTFDVFLSHGAKDRPIVRELANRLRSDGLRVWFDEGDSNPARVEEGLERSRVMVLCMSASTFGVDWPRLETGTLRFRDLEEKNRRFVPLRLDDAPIHDSLRQFLCIDWRSEMGTEGYSKLLEACRPSVSGLSEKTHAPDEREAKSASQLDSKNAGINDYAFSLDRRRVLTAGANATVRLWDLATGRQIQEFKGHSSSYVYGLAWVGDQHNALSGGSDGTMRLWDIESGRCLRVFEGNGQALGVAWNTDQGLALVGSFDCTVRVWDIEAAQCVAILKGHTGIVRSVTWSVAGSSALSGSDDRTVRLWDLETARCVRVFEGHTELVWAVVVNRDGRLALSSSADNTIRLWEVESGRCLRVFAEHTGSVYCAVWSANEQLILSGSGDHTVRLWDLQTGNCLSVLRGHKSLIRGLAWSTDGRFAFSGDQSGDIRVWDLSEIVEETRQRRDTAPTRRVARDQVQYTNAKILLVGDTGVGKSGLASRLIDKRFVATKSSHARKAHVLETSEAPGAGGIKVHRESVLWDLAGQPAYRLVHQLSMEDAALACVLFDNRNETNPLEGAAYWSQVLDQARTNTKLQKLLVASRIDVGGLPASRERIDGFAKEQGFAKFIATSANTGEGCDELLDAIRTAIPWNQLPTVTTEGPLAPLRSYVAKLKGEKDGYPGIATKLLNVAQLYEGFTSDYGTKSHSQSLFHTCSASKQPTPSTCFCFIPPMPSHVRTR